MASCTPNHLLQHFRIQRQIIPHLGELLHLVQSVPGKAASSEQGPEWGRALESVPAAVPGPRTLAHQVRELEGGCHIGMAHR